MASDSYDSKSLEMARQLLEVTSITEAEVEVEQLPSLPSGFYDAFVLRGIRVVQALQPGTLLYHFTVPSRLLISHLAPFYILFSLPPESSCVI
jgi:acyl-coenzyme A thioesterase 13